jgi:hypothetical protein
LIAQADKGFGGNLVIPLSEDLFGLAAPGPQERYPFERRRVARR